MMHKLITFFLVVFILISFTPTEAHAYIDPGSGSFFMQMIAAGMIGAAFHFRRFFSKLLFWKNKDEELAPLSDKEH